MPLEPSGAVYTNSKRGLGFRLGIADGKVVLSGDRLDSKDRRVTTFYEMSAKQAHLLAVELVKVAVKLEETRRLERYARQRSR